jgi:hypothetical protein
MGNSTPIFLTRCERLGAFDFSPTSGGAGGPLSVPKEIC